MRWSNALQEELDNFRRQKSHMEYLSTRVLAFEAAMKVLAKHDLMAEFANELRSEMDAIRVRQVKP